jgi:hypothetical protein
MKIELSPEEQQRIRDALGVQFFEEIKQEKKRQMVKFWRLFTLLVILLMWGLYVIYPRL